MRDLAAWFKSTGVRHEVDFMCLLLFAFKAHPSYKLVLAANRDEYYDRPTSPAAYWEDAPDILSGRDLRAGGTWLGITRSGRIGSALILHRYSAVRKPVRFLDFRR